jgi:hypothetical protein
MNRIYQVSVSKEGRISGVSRVTDITGWSRTETPVKRFPRAVRAVVAGYSGSTWTVDYDTKTRTAEVRPYWRQIHV